MIPASSVMVATSVSLEDRDYAGAAVDADARTGAELKMDPGGDIEDTAARDTNRGGHGERAFFCAQKRGRRYFTPHGRSWLRQREQPGNRERHGLNGVIAAAQLNVIFKKRFFK